ncbi:hypothetical protein PoB_006983000 [Plakobranchus ocellatus]|uniref:Uncharacterized protein n=1 Tax=Plakobranchus ocellatus TaxID=259542 RepID=A0AAV4DH85_9GAST|nr:hypothetical protein PoB_006983000 [Plakobranchus ocellatus]
MKKHTTSSNTSYATHTTSSTTSHAKNVTSITYDKPHKYLGQTANNHRRRDLEEHRTSAHKDLEDLFAEEMKRQNERDEEEKQNRDLFE